MSLGCFGTSDAIFGVLTVLGLFAPLFTEQGKLVYSAQYSNGKLWSERKGEDPNQEVSQYDGNGILILIRIGDRVVYERWYSGLPPTQSK
jgi:hypothetical protein